MRFQRTRLRGVIAPLLKLIMEFKMKLLLLITMLSIFSYQAIETKAAQKKTKFVLVTKHPEKGSFVSEIGKDVPEHESFKRDKENCSEIVFSKGVEINGSVSTNKAEIEKFLDDAYNLRVKFMVGLRKKHSKSELSMRKEAERVHSDRWACMESIGWSRGLEEVEVNSNIETQ